MYRWAEHTGELELHIDAPTDREVFAEALAALAELHGAGTGPRTTRSVQLEAPDRAALLVRWLDELLFLAETEGLVAGELRDFALADGRLTATVAVRRGAPRPLVKAATYHGLRYEEAPGGRRATVVLDV